MELEDHLAEETSYLLGQATNARALRGDNHQVDADNHHAEVHPAEDHLAGVRPTETRRTLLKPRLDEIPHVDVRLHARHQADVITANLQKELVGHPADVTNCHLEVVSGVHRREDNHHMVENLKENQEFAAPTLKENAISAVHVKTPTLHLVEMRRRKQVVLTTPMGNACLSTRRNVKSSKRSKSKTKPGRGRKDANKATRTVPQQVEESQRHV